MRAARSLACLVLTSALAGCSGSGGLDAAALGLPSSPAPPARATATVSTSPDGGIYNNPDHLAVLLVRRHDVAPIVASLGPAASSWSALDRFGDFTVVAVSLRDDGKVSSDPSLSDLQLASDYAPPGTSTGPLRHWYHPTYPLAVVSDRKPGDDCSVHLDPGHTVVAILVYPPVELPSTVVWGRLGDFVLSIPAGGSLPPIDGSLHAVACTPPVAPPT